MLEFLKSRSVLKVKITGLKSLYSIKDIITQERQVLDMKALSNLFWFASYNQR